MTDQRPSTAGAHATPRRRRGVGLAGVLLSVASVAVAGSAVITTAPPPDTTTAALTADDAAADIVAPVPVSAADLAALPAATTFTTLTEAPRDPDPTAVPSGTLVHPRQRVPVYRAPGQPAVAALPAQQLGSDTWVPVIARQTGWAQVLLPTRPQGSTGWLYLDDPHLTTAHTPYRLVVDRERFTLTLLRDGQPVGTWPVGVGKPVSPTPAGRTFLLASIREQNPTFSPIVLPLGTHSATYTTYGGGPGTVGIHTWPTDDVYGQPSSDGCVRVPSRALHILSTTVPIGSAVLIQ